MLRGWDACPEDGPPPPHGMGSLPTCAWIQRQAGLNPSVLIAEPPELAQARTLVVSLSLPPRIPARGAWRD